MYPEAFSGMYACMKTTGSLFSGCIQKWPNSEIHVKKNSSFIFDLIKKSVHGSLGDIDRKTSM